MPPTQTSDNVDADTGAAGSPDSLGSPAASTFAPVAPVAPIDPALVRVAGSELFLLWLKIAGTLLAARLLVALWPVLLLLLLSVMLATALHPVVRRLQRRFTRTTSITFLVLAMLLVLAALVALTVPPIVRQAQALADNLPRYLKEIEESLGRFAPAFHKMAARWSAARLAAQMEPQTAPLLMGLAQFVTQILTVLVMTTYLLIEGPSIATFLVGLFPRARRLLLRQMGSEAGNQVGGYLRGQLVTSALAGGFSTLLLFVLAVPEPLAMGALMAVADAIPLAGLLVGMVPAVLIALTKDANTAVIVLVGYLLYRQVENYVIVPRVFGRTLRLSPLTVTLAILVGATLLGVLGALLALPVAAAIPTISRYLAEWRRRAAADAAANEV